MLRPELDCQAIQIVRHVDCLDQRDRIRFL